MSLKISAKSTEAQAKARLDSTEWKRYLSITKQEAKTLAAEHREWSSWVQVHADAQANVLRRVNEQLEAEKIPKIHVDILDWRMSQVVRRVSSLNTPQREISSLADRPHEQPPAEQPPAKQLSASKMPYDPVKDDAMHNG
ncbi:uncharacterized protein BDZ99DRAFT_428028 [Mytilinidion resinicola]|uniref:Uncharacterized protein n=1 Tax=Mytilinidion resinicola TaxID=574789 RepID=A0A6A6Y2K6_9PEZI|nr:uncharacterized protein BDZ99DRAFT_428028 [Mytilinidion resinicola]KAF2803022.1 hypothetical protein BDZ99DRAFT_428028 [Mytilinidion resinicola]